MAYGAYQACQQYRIEGKVHLIGVDGFEGESAGLSLVDKGVLDATIQTPDFGGLSYEIARKLLEGNKVEKKYYYPAGIDSSGRSGKAKSNCSYEKKFKNDRGTYL